MEIFLDTANIDDIRKFAHLIDGVTTNPTLLAKESTQPVETEKIILEIIGIVNGPISVEVISTETEGMVKEAEGLASISHNIVIKVPVTANGLRATRILSELGIRTNVTLVFSSNQALLAAKANATYASIFVGRLDDIGQCGMSVVSDTLSIYQNYGFKTHIITASIRHPLHVLEAAKLGSQVATIPPGVLDLMMKHNLTETGLKKFLDDWQKIHSGVIR